MLQIVDYQKDAVAEPKFVPLIENHDKISMYADYVLAKGGSDAVVEEISESVVGSCNVQLAEYYDMFHDALEGLVPFRFEPVSYDVVVRRKNRKSSPGLPFSNFWTTFDDLLSEFESEEEGFQALAGLAEDYERLIMEGKPPTAVFRVHSKKDKYSRKKIQLNSFRTIQAGDLFLLWVMQKYILPYAEALEIAVPGIFLVTDSAQYAMKVAPLRSKWTFGVDFTRYDKTESMDLMARTLKMLCDLAGVPALVAQYVVFSVAAPILVTPGADDELFFGCGSNPSGQLLTSVCNSLNHLLYNGVIYSQVFNTNFRRYVLGLASIRSVATGDDGIEAFQDEETALVAMRWIPILLWEYFGVIAKIETANGKPFPPGTMCPYLSQVEVQVPCGWVRVPSRPSRNLGNLQYEHFECMLSSLWQENYREKLTGVLDSMSGFLLLQLLKPDYPVPEQFLALLDLCRDFGVSVETTVERVSIGWLPE